MTEKIFPSPLGPLELISSGHSLVYCNWQHPDCTRKKQKIISRFQGEGNHEEEMILQETALQLEGFFAGKRWDFDLPVLLYGTEFQKKVWEAISRVPYGETATYGEIALLIGMAEGVRGVAAACGKNPLAVIMPCHRIVSKAGLGGYTGGLDKKKRILWMEKSQKILIGK